MMVSYFSVTYKLKLNKGDIKAVQGDSGHSQTDMVTDVYSHIIDEDRKKNAELFEDAFYKKNNLDPNMVSEEVDMELLMKALANPEMRALLNSLAKTMKTINGSSWQQRSLRKNRRYGRRCSKW